MPRAVRRSTLFCALFVTPLLLAVLLSLVGLTVVARDDANYLAELSSRGMSSLSIDPASWLFLIGLSKLIGVSSFSLRLAGLITALLTLVVLRRSGVDRRAIAWFVVSLFPLYFTIYFNQLRLAVAVFLFFAVVTSRFSRAFAIPVASLGHISFLFILFPPIVAISPFVVGVLELLDPGSLFVLKLLAYTEGGLEAKPWYFGWEIIGGALLFLTVKREWRIPMEMLAVVIGVRFLADNISLDVGRRILELGMIAYSPVMLFLIRRVKPFKQINWYYCLLGMLQIIIVLKSDVIRFG